MSKPQKRGKRWRIQWTDAEGERKSATFATFDQARSELRRLEVETEDEIIQRRRNGRAASTVRDAYARFVETLKPDPNNTERRFAELRATHERMYRLHIEPHIGDRKLCELDPDTIADWIAKVAATKTARPGERNEDGRTLSASTVRKAAVTLRQIAKANRVTLEIELADSLKQKRRRKRPRALQTIEDVRALLAACREPWFRVAAAISCYCGARLGEVASLRWRDIGPELVTIARSWEGPLKARYEDEGEDAARVVPLHPELASILTAWRTLTGGGPDDRVVLVDGKRPLRERADDVAAKTRSACRRAGLAPLPFHSLRATFATLAADAGLPLGKLQALLGHADASTTAIYIRPESEHAARDPRALIGAPDLHQTSRTDPEHLN